MQPRVRFEPLSQAAELTERENVTLESVSVYQPDDGSNHSLQATQVQPVDHVQDLEASLHDG